MVDWRMGFQVYLFLFLCSLPDILAQEPIDATIIIRTVDSVALTDDNFVCATLDWWPPEKCNYNQCPWGQASVLNLDLSHPLLAKSIQAFNPLRIRIGGSLQDQVVYDVGDSGIPCQPFRKLKDGLFGFSEGCLQMDRWDELNSLFDKAGAIVTFGLNALRGRHQTRNQAWEGAWNSSNAVSFISYTISKGYPVDSWEFGNELSGSGVGARVNAKQYGKDLISLKAMLNELYKNSHLQPLLLAPGGFYDQKWFADLLQVSRSGTLDVITHHIYNLGAGDDPNLVSKIMDPHHLSQIAKTFEDVQLTIKRHGPWASAWVGESGGAYNSGGPNVSDTYVNSYWYLDQLGMASKYNTKAYCRQSLIGGNYGLLDTTTFIPNPDYYSALLWHRLMGKRVLSTEFSASPFLRTYAHCSRGKAGVTLLLINLNNSTGFSIEVQEDMNINLHRGQTIHSQNSFVRVLKKSVAWVGRRASDGTVQREEYHLTPMDGYLQSQTMDGTVQREEYHLTPMDGYLQSQTMVLNGKALVLNEDGDIPALDPILVDATSPIYVAPLSIAFVSFPYFDAPACA